MNVSRQDHLYTQVFSYEMVSHRQLTCYFKRIEDLVHACISRIFRDTFWVQATLIDIYGKIMAGITRGRCYFTTEDRKKKKAEGILYSPEELEFLPRGMFLIHHLLSKPENVDPNVLLDSGLTNSVYEEIIDHFTTQCTEYYDTILEWAHVSSLIDFSDNLGELLQKQTQLEFSIRSYENEFNVDRDSMYCLMRDVLFLRLRIAKLKTKIVRPYLRLVYSIARKQSGGATQTFYDNFQNGTMGLLHAISYFDYQRGLGFGPYAKWWIKQSMLLKMKEENNTINLPTSTWQAHNHIERVRARLSSDGKTASPQKIAAEAGYTVEQLTKISSNVMNAQARSLDYFIDDENKATLLNLIVSPEEGNEKQTIEPFLKYLNPLQRTFICLSYGLSEHIQQEEDLDDEELFYERLRQAAIQSKFRAF